jgi:hypothetical protein
MITRRLTLVAPALLLAHPAPAALLPGTGRVVLERAEDGRAVMRCESTPQTITFPATRARIAMMLPLAGRDLAGLAFGADTPAGRLDLLALAGWDGAQLRILGLEVLAWTGADGSSLSSRFASYGDRSALRVQRTAGSRQPPAEGKPARTRWESWTDVLAWKDRSILTDAPIRPGAERSWQARLAERRARLAALLQPACTDVTMEMVALAGSDRPATGTSAAQ